MILRCSGRLVTQFDLAADVLGMSEDVRQRSKQPRRCLTSAFRSAWTAVRSRSFEGYRVQHNISTGPAQGRHPLPPRRHARRKSQPWRCGMSWKCSLVRLAVRLAPRRRDSRFGPMKRDLLQTAESRSSFAVGHVAAFDEPRRPLAPPNGKADERAFQLNPHRQGCDSPSVTSWWKRMPPFGRASGDVMLDPGSPRRPRPYRCPCGPEADGQASGAAAWSAGGDLRTYRGHPRPSRTGYKPAGTPENHRSIEIGHDRYGFGQLPGVDLLRVK